MSKTNTNVLDKFFRNENREIVIWQTPNLPLVAWLICLLGSIFAGGQLKNDFRVLGTAFLFTWAYLEVTAGASLFRRWLGVVVLAGIIVKTFNSVT